MLPRLLRLLKARQPRDDSPGYDADGEGDAWLAALADRVLPPRNFPSVRQHHAPNAGAFDDLLHAERK